LHPDLRSAGIRLHDEGFDSPGEGPIAGDLDFFDRDCLFDPAELRKELAVHGFYALLSTDRWQPGWQEYRIVGDHGDEPVDVLRAHGGEPVFRELADGLAITGWIVHS
jgi:hypothetical protein